MRTNATVYEAHQIAVEECNRVVPFYVQQVPAHVGRMIFDAMIQFGLIELGPDGAVRPTMAALVECVECGMVARVERRRTDEGAWLACRVCASGEPPVPVVAYTPPKAPDPAAPSSAEGVVLENAEAATPLAGEGAPPA